MLLNNSQILTHNKQNYSNMTLITLALLTCILLVVIWKFFYDMLHIVEDSKLFHIVKQRVVSLKAMAIEDTYQLAVLTEQLVKYKYIPFISRKRYLIRVYQVIPYSHLINVINDKNINLTAKNTWHGNEFEDVLCKNILSVTPICTEDYVSTLWIKGKDIPWQLKAASFVYSYIYTNKKPVQKDVTERGYTFKDYQSRALEFGIYKDKMSISNNGNEVVWIYPILGLCGEAGEVADKLKKILRDKGGIISDDDKIAIQLELGDVMWYLSELCTRLNISLEETAKANINKLNSRMNRGMIGGSGDVR
jgi:NTP pyrophosphatase (non-canonical NTP hydrolase)